MSFSRATSRLFPLCAALVFLVSCGGENESEPSITLAVSSNFVSTAKDIAAEFTADTDIQVIVVSGSTGKLTAQIQQGAPFDVFLSADTRGPATLEKLEAAVPATRVTYALGRLALHSRDPDLVDDEGAVLRTASFNHLAIANPDLAPYGRAAEEVLSALNLIDQIRDHLVRGENIAQTFHFVESGNAELGFVAFSQVHERTNGSTWLVPPDLHSPIEQDSILIQDTDEGRAFLTFLKSEPARRLIENAGYQLPSPSHVE